MARGVLFEIAVVCGNESKRLVCIKLRQKSFGNSSTQLRFCTGSELVYEQKGVGGGYPAKVTHADKVRTIRTKVVFDALIVANIDG